MVSVRPHLAGSASGLGGAVMAGAGAALSVLAGFLLRFGDGVMLVLWLMFTCAVLAIASTEFIRLTAKNAASEDL
jgi:MFS transporter, DHA1 family, multidrug resistance protein